MPISLDSLMLSRTNKHLDPLEREQVRLLRWESHREQAINVLRFLADQLESGILKAGIGYRVTLELEGDKDRPIVIGN